MSDVTVTGLTAEEMSNIRNKAIVGAVVNGAGYLILTQYDGTVVNAGYVQGSVTPESSEAMASTLIKRDVTGQAKVGTPTDDQHIVPKLYLDTNVAAALASANAYSNGLVMDRQISANYDMVPNDFAIGITRMDVDGSGDSRWPELYSHVITQRVTNQNRTVQDLHAQNTYGVPVQMHFRRWSASSGAAWGPWRMVSASTALTSFSVSVSYSSLVAASYQVIGGICTVHVNIRDGVAGTLYTMPNGLRPAFHVRGLGVWGGTGVNEFQISTTGAIVSASQASTQSYIIQASYPIYHAKAGT